MNKYLLKEIYTKVGEDYLDKIQIEEFMNAELELLWETLQELEIPLKRHGQIESVIWSATGIVEQEAFMAGMAFAVRLVMELQ